MWCVIEMMAFCGVVTTALSCLVANANLCGCITTLAPPAAMHHHPYLITHLVAFWATAIIALACLKDRLTLSASPLYQTSTKKLAFSHLRTTPWHSYPCQTCRMGHCPYENDVGGEANSSEMESNFCLGNVRMHSISCTIKNHCIENEGISLLGRFACTCQAASPSSGLSTRKGAFYHPRTTT